MTATTAVRAARGRRARVIIVGQTETLPAWALHLAQPPSRAANLFEALGEIAASSAGEPIAAVMIPESCLQPPHEHAVESLRKLDPSVRVIVMGAGDVPPTLPRGCDAWLAMPFGADDVRRALDDDGLFTSTPAAAPPLAAIDPPQPQASEISSPTPPVIELDDAMEPARSAAPVAPEPANILSSPLESPSAQSVAKSSRESTAVPVEIPPTPAGDIGDTDLIHAMLHDQRGLAPLALRLIVQHSGWDDLQFALGEFTQNPGDGSIEVASGAHSFGRLRAPSAAPASLRAWADWLGHWLNLERVHRQLQHLANCDDLTGAWNRRHFNAFLGEAILRARAARRPVTLMVFDIDNFKSYNDSHGHEAGDEILREIVRLLKSVIRQGDIVCRIGGDEFAVVFADPEGPREPGSQHPESVESIARRFQQAVCSMRFPKLGVEAPGTLSVSAGLATFPWDGQDAAALLRHADHLALHSKRQGKNNITIGRGIGEQTSG